MPDAKKQPVILVIDDAIANDEWRKESAIRTITEVIDTLGYDAQQKELIMNNVRFFAQYDEHDGPQPREECAAHYLKDRKGDTEVPVLAFVDNTFKVSKDYENYHGHEIISDLKSEAEKRGEKIQPAIVWISTNSPPENTIDAEKLTLQADDPKAIFELAKSPFQKPKEWDGRRATWDSFYEESKKSKDQVLVHTLRDAFEAIAGRPAQQPWKTRVAPAADATGQSPGQPAL
jgi:hypothetical protein